MKGRLMASRNEWLKEYLEQMDLMGEMDESDMRKIRRKSKVITKTNNDIITQYIEDEIEFL